MPRESYSMRVGNVSESMYSSVITPLTRIWPSVPPLSPSFANAKSPIAPAYAAAAPNGLFNWLGSMTFGMLTARMSWVEHACGRNDSSTSAPPTTRHRETVVRTMLCVFCV